MYLVEVVHELPRRLRQYGWREGLAISRIELRHALHRHRERVVMWVAWRLPKELVMWAYVRVASHATTGQYGSTVVPELSMMDALKRWDSVSDAQSDPVDQR